MTFKEIMFTIGSVMLSLLIIIVIVYHGQKEIEERIKQGNQIPKSWEIITYIDPETGVNYLIFDHYGKAGATVRVDQDGKPIVTRKDD